MVIQGINMGGINPNALWCKHCVLSNVSSNYLIAFVRYFSTVCFQMGPQVAFSSGCIITLVAFVRFFSTVYFQMSLQSSWLRSRIVTLVAIFCSSLRTFQIPCPRGYILTLVAFVWLFPTVCFQMFLQIACLGGCIVTLLAFVRLFSNVYFQMSLQKSWEAEKSYWLQYTDFSHVCVFTCIFKCFACDDAWSHWLHL